ncbi:uncharacterized protein [Palaemon carinicauda]|uniref:uncharacterized protein n=1 Tax=Palaemon carinicauda TaxID=392227 RepID=UPI0035B580EE
MSPVTCYSLPASWNADILDCAMQFLFPITVKNKRQEVFQNFLQEAATLLTPSNSPFSHRNTSVFDLPVSDAFIYLHICNPKAEASKQKNKKQKNPSGQADSLSDVGRRRKLKEL